MDPCCEGSTCKLKSFAECAYGDCCKDCQARTSTYQGQIREGKWISGNASSESTAYHFYQNVFYISPTSVHLNCTFYDEGHIELVSFGCWGLNPRLPGLPACR